MLQTHVPSVGCWTRPCLITDLYGTTNGELTRTLPPAFPHRIFGSSPHEHEGLLPWQVDPTYSSFGNLEQVTPAYLRLSGNFFLG